MDNTELTHHGILGMKWGVRRFQNKDGSLTTAGKKRLGRKNNDDDQTKPKPKTVKDMSDDELTQKIRRLQLEKQYRDLQPKEVSAGKDIAKKFLDQAVIPAATNMGKQFLEKQLKKALGLDEKKDDSLDNMKKKLDELRTTNQLYNQKKTYEKNKAEMEAERKAKEDAEKAERDAKKTEKAAKKESKVKVDAMGTDYSQYSSFKKGRDTVVDADFEDVPYDSPQSTSSASAGRQYITALLEEKN